MLTERQLRTVHSRYVKGPGCWMWAGSVDRGGYGTYGVHGGPRWAAHRLVYTLTIGAIPEGLQIDHLCRNTLCVNPAHLEPVTPAENVRRARNANASKTECRRGHPFDPENTYLRGGKRICRQCNAVRALRYKAQKRAAA